MRFRSVAKLVVLLFTMSCCGNAWAEDVPLTIAGGHETEPQDVGRPVVLIAAALGVKPEVFRKAFSGVTPAKDGRPSPEDARRNKEALMKVLKPYKVTNERLDEVSNYYRYRSGNGELWKVKAAQAYAVVENGKVVKVVLTEPGAGYSSPPKVTLNGMKNVEFNVTLNFEKDLKKNGGIQSIVVQVAKPAR